MNEKFTSISLKSDPSKLCPWRNFRPPTKKRVQKRRLEADDMTMKGRPPKRIVLQTRLQNNIRVR